MRRTLKRTTFFGVRSRGYRCRLERLESRSMMAADIGDAAVDFVPDEPISDNRIEEPALDAVVAWEGCVLQVCELPEFCEFPANEFPVFVDPTFADDPMFVDDSCLMVTQPAFPAFEPVDIRVQFVSSESDSSWAAYYYTVGADGVVQDVSVVASYDEPTIAAFVAEHADDSSVQISDYGDGWWIGGFPLELAPPVPERMDSSDDDVSAYGYSDGGTADGWDCGSVAGGWTWDESNGTYIWIDGSGGGDWTSTWDESATAYSDDWSYSTSSYTDIRVQYVSSETEPGWAAYYYTVGADGVVQDVSVWASYDESTIAAFVAGYADDTTVQIVDCGDGWWIGGFPLELAPPVPDAVSWCGLGGGDGTAYESTDVGVWDSSGSLDVASDWSWDGSDAISTWDENSESGGGWTCTLLPYTYARGAGVGESFGDDFVAYSATADADSAIDELSGDVAVAEPVAVSPRAAAFADMGTMAAAAAAMQAGSADATPVGGRRRR